MNDILIGAISVSCLVIGLFFLRFWKSTRDRFFIFFALSFWIEGIGRLCLSSATGLGQYESVSYGLRLVAYLCIVVAILDNNRLGKARKIGSEMQ